MVAVEVSGPSVETTEDEVLMLSQSTSQVSLISLVIPELSLSGKR